MSYEAYNYATFGRPIHHKPAAPSCAVVCGYTRTTWRPSYRASIVPQRIVGFYISYTAAATICGQKLYISIHKTAFCERSSFFHERERVGGRF